MQRNVDVVIHVGGHPWEIHFEISMWPTESQYGLMLNSC